MYLLILMFVVIAIVVLCFCFRFGENKKTLKRSSVSTASLLSEYLAKNGHIDAVLFDESLKKIAEIFSISVDKIYRSDVIGKDLGKAVPWSFMDSISMEDFYDYIHSRMEQKGFVDYGSVNTVEGFIKFEAFICGSGHKALNVTDYDLRSHR